MTTHKDECLKGAAMIALKQPSFDASPGLPIKGASRAIGIGFAVNRVIGIGGPTAARIRVRRCMGLVAELFKRQRHVPLTSIRRRQSQIALPSPPQSRSS